MMYCEEEDTPEGENKPSQTDALDAEAKRKGKRLDPAEKPLTKQSKEDAKAKRLAKQSEEDAKAKEKDGHSGKKSQKSSSSATDQVEEDAKAKLNKGSPPDLNAPSAISNSGAEFIDNTMKEMPAPIEQTAARSCSTSSSNRSVSSARSLADDEAKANARNQMVPSRVRREGGKGNPKVSSKEENMSDEAAKASARNQMVPSRVRRTGGGGGDEEFSAATVIEATVFPGSPPAIEYEEDGSILPGAQKVRVSGVNKLEYILDDDLEDLEGQPSSKNDDGPAKVRNDNLGHATAIVAELAPTDAEVSQKLQKMVEDRFDQELKKQVVVEAVQAVAVGNDEEGKKVCGVATSRKCWLLLVLGLLVIVAVAVGAGVGASKGGDSGSSESGTSNADAPLSETTNGPKEPAGTDAPVSGTATYGPQEPTGAPSNSRLGELLSAIGPTILENDPNALEPGTPTAQALDWMANTDRSNLDFVTTRSSVLVERYALAVFYFATNGPAWFNRNNFLEPTSVCSWNNGQVTAGIFCNGQSVAQIFMSKFLFYSRSGTLLPHNYPLTDDFVPYLLPPIMIQTAISLQDRSRLNLHF
jgi:hypothetical protein